MGCKMGGVVPSSVCDPVSERPLSCTTDGFYRFGPAQVVRRFGRALAALMLVWAGGAAEAGPADLLGPPDATVAGRDMDWYAQDWWQWAFSAPLEANAVSDLDGRSCVIGQRGLVWKLAGGFGTSLVHRACTIPADRYLFFPIVN